MWAKYVSCPEANIDPLPGASQFLKEARAKALSNVGLNRSPLLGLLEFALKLKKNGLAEQISTLCGKQL